MDFELLFEWVLVDLSRFDLSKVVFDVDEVAIGEDRDEEFGVVF